MSKGNGYITLDKYLVQEFKSIRREFSMIEAMFSFSLDADNGKKGSIAGYSKLWGWSRNKVRRFITGVVTEKGHLKDSKRTGKGHPIHFIDKALFGKKDTKRTVKGQEEDTTTNPISYNPKEKITKEIINFSLFFINFMCEQGKKRAPKKSNKLIEKSVLEVGRLITKDGFDLEYIKKVCKWSLRDDFHKKNFFSLSGLRKKWKNDLTKFQNMANSYDDSNRVGKIDGNNHFEGNHYEGTPRDEIDWM